MKKPEYDSQGRMRYDPEFHGKHKKPWTVSDEKYLIENYEKDGPEAVSFALERTIYTVAQRAKQLRDAGRMPPRRKGAKNAKRARFS